MPEMPIDPEYGRFIGGQPQDQDEEQGVAVDMPLDDAELEELPDGRVRVRLDTKGPRDDADFYANLADGDDINPLDLGSMALRYLELIEKDKEARSKRDEQYEEGIRRTGLGHDAPGGATFTGAHTSLVGDPWNMDIVGGKVKEERLFAFLFDELNSFLGNRIRHVFVDPPGSLTWVVPYEGGWLACFAHYAATSQVARSRLVAYDQAWVARRTWSFAPEVLAKFGRMSCSGGGVDPAGVVGVTGHDAKELYILELPPAGGVARLAEIRAFPGEGQAFAWDPSRPGELAAISRRQKAIVTARYE